MKCNICGNDNLAYFQTINDIRYNTNNNYRIMKCNKCKALITNDWQNLDLGQVYPKRQPNKEFKLNKKIYPKPINYVVKGRDSWIDDLNIKEDNNILVVGGATGDRAIAIKNKFKCKVYIIEPNKNYAKYLINKGLVVHEGMFSDFLSPCKFDYVLMIHVIEHLPNPNNDLKIAYKYLKKGGKLIVACPNTRSIERTIFGKFWDGWNVPRHIYHYTPYTLRYLLIKVGFKNVNIYYENYSIIARSILNISTVSNKFRYRILVKIILKFLKYIEKLWGFLLAVYKNSGAIQVICEK